MSQEPEEEQPTVFREVTPEDFCGAFNRAIAEGAELWTTNLGKFFRSLGMQNDLAGVDDALAEQALDARQEPSLSIELDRPGEPHCSHGKNRADSQLLRSQEHGRGRQRRRMRRASIARSSAPPVKSAKREGREPERSLSLLGETHRL